MKTADRKIRKRPEAEALRRALKRRKEESRGAYWKLCIWSEQNRLKDCRDPKCASCRDARLLIKHYRCELRKELAPA